MHKLTLSEIYETNGYYYRTKLSFGDAHILSDHDMSLTALAEEELAAVKEDLSFHASILGATPEDFAQAWDKFMEEESDQ